MRCYILSSLNICPKVSSPPRAQSMSHAQLYFLKWVVTWLPMCTMRFHVWALLYWQVTFLLHWLIRCFLGCSWSQILSNTWQHWTAQSLPSILTRLPVQPVQRSSSGSSDGSQSLTNSGLGDSSSFIIHISSSFSIQCRVPGIYTRCQSWKDWSLFQMPNHCSYRTFTWFAGRDETLVALTAIWCLIIVSV